MKDLVNHIFSGKVIRLHGKWIGFITKDMYFVMYKRASHKLRMLNGWAIAEAILEDLMQKGIKGIRVIVKGRGIEKVMVTSPQKWKRLGVQFRSRGYEPQIVLPEKMFDKVVSR